MCTVSFGPSPQAGSAVTGNLDAAQALPLRTGLGGLEPLTLAALCGLGMGLAVCPASGLVVNSGCLSNALSVWRLSASSSGATVPELTRVCTLGGEGSPPPMRFGFRVMGGGRLAFLPPTIPSGTPLLLITDGGHDAVHVIDVVGRAHVGYVASPGTIAGPRGVAVQGPGSLVAISAWRERDSGDHVVHLFKCSGSAWEAVRVIGGGFGAPGSEDGQLHLPLGLRFSATGAMICVADCGNARACLLRVEDGGFVRHVALDVDHPFDVEEVACGWLVACYESGAVEVWGDKDARWPLDVLDREGAGGLSYPEALALVPDVGLVVLDGSKGGRVVLYSTPDALAMAAMTPLRVGWMVGVARAGLLQVQLGVRGSSLPGVPPCSCVPPSKT
jgi:hypothetical protein